MLCDQGTNKVSGISKSATISDEVSGGNELLKGYSYGKKGQIHKR